MNRSPKQLGFMIPAEWEPHSAVWLAWPKDITTFVQGIGKAEATFCNIIKALEGSEKVELIVSSKQDQKRVADILNKSGADLSNINFYPVLYADVWTRDYGPTFLKREVWVKWEYNVYGKSELDEIYYKPLLKDNNVFNLLNIRGTKFEPGIIMEGGSVTVNGKGTLITTEQCLLNPNRNPNLTKEQTEQFLKDYLGVSKIIWLKRGLVNDHTDGHIDDIACFVAPNKILCAYEDDPNDENFSILKENYEVLSKATDQDGKPFELIKMPMPHMRYEVGHTVHSGQDDTANEQGEKAAVSYINFYIANKAVLVPTFGDPNDSKAIEVLKTCFPERKITAIDCQNIIYGGGTIHCMTQQQPA